MQAIDKQITIMIGGVSCIAKFPNIGEFIDIEQRKQVLSNGRYALLVMASSVESTDTALNMIEAISYLSVCIPELPKLMNVSNYMQLLNCDYQQGLELVDIYQKQFLPFLNKFLNLNSDKIKSESDDKTAGTKTV